MPKTLISNTLTSDNLPALLAPIECTCCHGSGQMILDGSHPNDPDGSVGPCENCHGLGTVPYPGTFADHLRDLQSEVIAGVQQTILDCKPAQMLRIVFDPNVPQWHFTLGDRYVSPKFEGSTHCAPDLEAACADAAQLFLQAANKSANQSQLDADVEAYRRQRALELGIAS